MAHIFEKAEKIAGVALGILQRTIVLPNLFSNRYGIADFKGAKGDVVNVKRPAILVAQDAGFRDRNPIVYQDLVQSRIQVKLSRYPIVPVQLSDEELTLDIENYSQDVTVPQVRALVEDFENTIADTLGAATFVHEVNYTPGADPRKIAIQARKLLNDSNVPANGRYWIVGSEVSAEIASFDKLLDVDTAGLPEAVREGVVGRLAGFTIVESNALDGDESYFVHNSALALAYVAPAAPKGATSSAIAIEGGLSVRQLFDYDSDTLHDRSILGVFTGGSVVTDPQIGDDGLVVQSGGEVQMEFIRAVKVNFGAANTAESDTWTLANTGSVTGGTFTLSVDGESTEPIAFDATNPVIRDAVNELDGVAGANVSGTTTKTITFQKTVIVTANSAAITGGGSKTVTKV
ncbi:MULTISPECIES: P22 phage major capsid protein family protein [unclassified Microbacterium]|uniref:P22 phage major capsid protein family protein n=1 Tax=unclassified Microbacterium TaxID=2609290 RepID=UPI0010F8BE2D|nr:MULTISPECIES: P22 phage major capsid protein family protein [unclassified Microbacterium]